MFHQTPKGKKKSPGMLFKNNQPTKCEDPKPLEQTGLVTTSKSWMNKLDLMPEVSFQDKV